MSQQPPADQELQRIESLRLRQQRSAARGCLIVMVLEGAALLAAILWLIATVLDMPRLRLAAAGAFLVFTLASALAAVLLLIGGNLPSQRRLRREAEARNRPRS